MIERLFSSLSSNSDKTAIFVKGEAFTYHELADRTAYLQDLFKQEIPGHSRIGIMANDDLTTYANIIACLLSGITFVPIDPSHPQERNSSVISQSGIRYIFDSQLSSRFSNLNSSVEVSWIFSGGNSSVSVSPVYHEITGNTWAYILFTSGTTGIPKGVPISRDNLISFLKAAYGTPVNIQADDRFMQVFDLTFDLSVYSLLIPLIAGAAVYNLPKNGVRYSAAIAMIEEHNITQVLTVPSFVSLLRPYFKEINLPQIRTWLFCGEALMADMVKEWLACLPNAEVFNVYGPTEATIFCSLYQVGSGAHICQHNGIVSIGKPFPGVSFKILAEDGKEAGIGISGELCISGLQTTSGYLGNAVLNQQSFIEICDENGPQFFYKTGDLSYRDESADYYYIGRKDTQIKIQGFRVELGEIENAANKQEGVLESVAIAEPDKRGNPLIYLFVRGKNIEQQGFMNALRKHLPEYMIPRQVRFVIEFPLNLNGKIDKNELRKLINN